jgi:hypothetical protein
MRVKLVRKLANVINGIDLASVRVGDTVELNPRQAVLLIREGWAEPVDDESNNTFDEYRKPSFR